MDTGVDSRLGLQGTVKFSPEFTFVAQMLASRLGDKDFDVHAEWLYGQYTPFAGLDIRLGRVVLPTFMISDTRNVGYAQTWFRAPTEVYGPLPLTNLDGIQGQWRVNAGPVTLNTQLSYGNTSVDAKANGLGLTFSTEDMANVNFSAEYGDWLARVGYTYINAPLTLPVIPGGLSFQLKDNFYSAGLQYDNGSVIVLTEWAKRKEKNFAELGDVPLNEETAWYVAAGYRFGKLTPMLRYSKIKVDDTASLIKLPDNDVIGASLRYDVARNVALKLQVDRYDASNLYGFTAPAATKGTKVNVVSFGADFVF
jgi:predicted porin